MKRVFSVPPATSQSEPASGPESPPAETGSMPPPAKHPRPSIYVQEVTEQHRNAIARILARVKRNPAPPPPPEPPADDAP